MRRSPSGEAGGTISQAGLLPRARLPGSTEMWPSAGHWLRVPVGGSVSPPTCAGTDSLRAEVGGAWGLVSFRSNAPTNAPMSRVLLPKSPSRVEREVERRSTRVCACASSLMRITTSLVRRETCPRVRA